MNCIIIDDDDTARAILKNLCLRNGHVNVVSEFTNVKDSLKYLKEQEVDLILLDIHMKGLSGFDLLDRLKHKSFRRAQVVIITIDEKLAFKAWNYNCTDYLLKPFDLLRFNKAIYKVRKKYILGLNCIEVKGAEILSLN